MFNKFFWPIEKYMKFGSLELVNSEYIDYMYNKTSVPEIQYKKIVNFS